MKNILLALEGPDKCAKSEISVELCRRLNAGYFKNGGEWTADLRSPDYFKKLLEYGATLLVDFFVQVKCSVILDRFYPSEWVYSRVFERDTNEEVLRLVDEKFSQCGGVIVLCRRKSYNGIVDDLHSFIDSQMLEKLDAEYENFKLWTTCKVVEIFVDDHDLDRQCNDIIKGLENLR